MKRLFVMLASITAAGLAIGAAAGPAFAGETAGAGRDPRLGEKVGRICFGRAINNFSTVKGEDDAALLERGVNDWYKVTLIGACDHNRLRFAQSVAIESRPAGGCVTPGDTLVFSDSAFGDFSFPHATRCMIDEIYEWDPLAKAEGEDDPPED